MMEIRRRSSPFRMEGEKWNANTCCFHFFFLESNLSHLALSLSPSTELPHPHTNFSVPNKVPPALFFSLELFFSIPALLSSLSFQTFEGVSTVGSRCAERRGHLLEPLRSSSPAE